MWFGTDNGLARFDGRRIQNFSPDGSGPNRVLALKAAASGDLWVGTQTGAFVYSDSGFHLIDGTKGIGVTAIMDGEDTIFGTDTGMVMRINADAAGNRSAENLLTTPIQNAEGFPLAVSGLAMADGAILASTSGRGVLAIRDGRASELSELRMPLFVNSIASDETGTLSLGADAPTGLSGLYEETGSAFARISLPTARVLALENNDSGLWVGTERFGVFHIVGSKLKKAYTFENTSGGLRSNTVNTFFTDREGVVWIGTNRGVSRFDRLGAEQQTVSDVANSNFIRTLAVGDQIDGSRRDQYFAGSNRGLFFRDDKDNWSEIPGLRNKVIYDLKFRGAPSIFVGTSDGLYDISGRKLADGDVRSFASFGGRDYAAFFGRGVIDVTTVPPKQSILNDAGVTSVYAGLGKLWIGTADKGLYSFDGQNVRSEIGPEVLKSGTIWGMSHLSEEDGFLYLAGQHGVFRVRNQKAEKLIDAEDVRDVLIDGKYIWAATTTRGLIHAKRDSRFGWLVNYLGFEQGLPSEKAFAILATDDGILIATNRGIVRYKSSPIPPKLIATRVLSQRVHDLAEIGGKLDLEYPQNALLVEVAGQSSRTFPEEFQYVFVLVNSTGEEIARQLSNDSQYAPSDLAPGEYTIEAIAFNRDLLASEPLTIRFSVAKAPFPWTATALGVLLVIALLGLVWAFVANRRVLVRNRELAAAKLDLANEAERERRRIARDLHDQTLADLRSLMLLSDARKPEIEGFRDEIEAISGEVRRICEDLSPSVLENVGLVAALEFLLKSAIEKHSFVAKENLEEGIGFPMNIQLQIYRIAQEVLTNIKSHSTADTVEMIVDEHDGEFVMEIRDNGDAFDPESVTSRGRGIANIKARASMIGADIDWEQAEGNRFVLGISK